MTPKDALAAARREHLGSIVASRHVIVCTGAGGVGKTTTAAALALGAARAGRNTIVCTIDPAWRLAQALGLESLEHTPRPVGVPGLAGRLDAMMLDMRRAFDEVIERHAPDPERAARITSNRFYQQLSDTLAGTQEYMAMEKLYELHTAGEYDCIVIDTPPTRNALDFLDAPKRLTDFLEGRFLKVLMRPGLSAGRAVGRAVGFGAGLFMKAASRVTGATVLDDLAGFFQSFDGMYEGFKDRAQAVYHLLQHPSSAFVVVASPEAPALREARFFLQRLGQDGMPTAGLVVNRRTPPAGPALAMLGEESTATLLSRLDAGDRSGDKPGDKRTTLVRTLLQLHLDRVRAVAREERAVRAALHGVDPVRLVEVPLLATDVHDVADLDRLGDWLYGEAGTATYH